MGRTRARIAAPCHTRYNEAILRVVEPRRTGVPPDLWKTFSKRRGERTSLELTGAPPGLVVTVAVCHEYTLFVKEAPDIQSVTWLAFGLVMNVER